jgi:hypothetical protein
VINFIFSIFLIFVLFATSLGCEKKEGTFFVGALGLDSDRIILASQSATVLTVTSYDLNGNLLATLADYYAETNGPRGLAIFDSLHFLLSLEGTDRVDLVHMGGGGYLPYLTSSFLTGTIGKLMRHPTTNDLFIIEAGTAIERFDLSGTRIPQTGNAFIQGALAPCAAPATARAMVVNNSGELLVIQSGSTAAFRLTIGPTVASACTVATLTNAANDLVNHSDGNIYYAGTNSTIYRASQTLTGSAVVFNNAATIALPTAMAELPNGNLIIASDTTDSIEVITTSGTYVGSLIKNIHTQQVHSILVVRGQ